MKKRLEINGVLVSEKSSWSGVGDVSLWVSKGLRHIASYTEEEKKKTDTNEKETEKDFLYLFGSFRGIWRARAVGGRKLKQTKS